MMKYKEIDNQIEKMQKEFELSVIEQEEYNKELYRLKEEELLAEYYYSEKFKDEEYYQELNPMEL